LTVFGCYGSLEVMNRKTNQVRIIGGKWRGRKIKFSDLPDLRPTHDRIRETLFNWLAPVIQGAACLDLFAGSGALGFEAISRGAQKATLVDQGPEIITAINKNIQMLNAQDSIESICAVFPNISPLKGRSYDIVFLDPPYSQGLLEKACEWLNEENLLNNEAYVYVEFSNSEPISSFPDNFLQFQSKSTQTLTYKLFKISYPRKDS